MNCPQCGTPNPDDAVQCDRCDAVLRPAEVEPAAAEAVAPGRTSLLAVASFVLATMGSVGNILIIFVFVLDFPVRVFLRDLGGLGIPCIWYPMLYLLPIPLGVVARRCIETGPERLAGRWLARAGTLLGTLNIVLGVLLYFVAVWGRFPGPGIDGNIRGVIPVRNDMRSLAAAIEEYYVDHNIYPAWGIGANGPGGAWTYNYSLAPRAKADEPRRSWHYTRKQRGEFVWYEKTPNPNHPADQLNFALNGPAPGQRFATLTTPKAYIRSYPVDYFSTPRGATFAYWSVFYRKPDPSGRIVGVDSPTSHGGWILVSPGPDRKYDILPDDWDVYNPAVAQPTVRLLTGTNKRGRAFTYDPTNGTISDGDIWRVKQ
jgi:hypothetical protein